MAGLWVVTMILMFGLIGLAISVVFSITLILIAGSRIPTGTSGRGPLLTACGFAPFLGFLWIIATLFIHVWVSNHLAHQDCGLSGDPYVTLPNGYVLGSLNTYNGYIVAPGYKTDTPVTGPGYVRSLIDIDYKGGNFVGTFDGGSIVRFVFNTRDRSIQTVHTTVPVSFEQVQNMVHRDDLSYWNLYAKYRHHWPNYLLAFLILAGWSAIAFWIWRGWNSIEHRAAI